MLQTKMLIAILLLSLQGNIAAQERYTCRMLQTIADAVQREHLKDQIINSFPDILPVVDPMTGETTLLTTSGRSKREIDSLIVLTDSFNRYLPVELSGKSDITIVDTLLFFDENCTAATHDFHFKVTHAVPNDSRGASQLFWRLVTLGSHKDDFVLVFTNPSLPHLTYFHFRLQGGNIRLDKIRMGGDW